MLSSTGFPFIPGNRKSYDKKRIVRLEQLKLQTLEASNSASNHIHLENLYSSYKAL